MKLFKSTIAEAKHIMSLKMKHSGYELAEVLLVEFARMVKFAFNNFCYFSLYSTAKFKAMNT
jgi:hypothetical protein